MGRMKEVFMQMREDEWEGDPNEYLKQYVEKHMKDYEVHIKDITCPNCGTPHLFQVDKHEYYCEVCAYEFIEVENSLRFK